MSTANAATEESIKLWLKVGNLKKLEQAVLDGYGEQLRGRNSRIPKINKFLKRVPHFQAKIAAVHDAAAQGNLRELENLLDRKGLVYARGSQGETPFHTAILNKQTPIIQYMLEKFPAILQARDHQGRTPLHYAAIVENGAKIFNMLLAAGADKEVKDLMGKTPSDYAKNPSEYQMKQNENLKNTQSRISAREFSSLLRQPSPITLMTKTEVKSMIQKGDLTKLERAILHGYGERMLGETAISTRVRDLLESIPEHLNKLVALQNAIESGSVRDVQQLLNRKGLVQARDSQGLTILHKAVLHGQKDIVKYLISVCPRAIFAKDHDKRTPVHYAAALEDNGEIYNLLLEAGGNSTLPDCDGKTPEFYRQNPSSLDLKKILEKRLESSGKLSNTNSQRGQNKTSSKATKRDQSGISVTGSSNSAVKQWLRSGDIEKLEKAVIDGYGLKLIRETTVDPRAKAFLRTVPAYMAKIGAIHEAVCQGSLRDFKVLMDRKKLVLCRDPLGLGLLHKAVLYGHEDIVKYFLHNFPETIVIKDKSGRMALHYAAVVKNKEEMYNLLIEAGADPNQPDVKGNTAQHYYENENEIDVVEIQNRVNRQRNRLSNAGKQIKPSTKAPETGFNITGANIRKWIHAEDIKKLEQVVLEGQGYKLLLETSNNPRVKHFLVSVPSLVNKIREIHTAVVLGDLTGVESAIDKPSLLLSKDEVGMTPLHKAVLLEQEEIMQFIVNTNSQALQIKDEEGKTALHYAAGLKDNGRTYEMLEKAGADPQIADSVGELDMRQMMSHVNRSKPAGYGKQETSSNSVKRQVAPNLRPVRKVSNNGITSETITKVIQQGDIEKLEQLVLDGYGKKLVGKSSWNEDVRMFLKKVPHYMDRIYAIHTAAALGDLKLLQQLLDKKKMVLSKDEYGLTALHKAVKYGQMDVVKYLLQTFPASHSAKDQDGRTPLHYAGLYKDRGEIYNLLVANGADLKVHDQRGRTPEHYFNNQCKLEAPTPPPKPLEKLSLDNSEEKSGKPGEEAVEDDKEIEEWITAGDMDKLELLVISGQGDKLLGKASEDEKVQEFLEAVPAYMGKIRAIHNAAASGELKDVQALLDRDMLAVSLDEHEACPMHRAVLHGHKDVMKFLANNYPICLKVKDKTGLTPLHYAALNSNDGYFYRLLSNAGADPNVKDNNGFTPGQILRGSGPITLDDLLKRYEEKKVPPRPHSVQMWERPPTEEILKALTPSPMTEEYANALKTQSQMVEDEKVVDGCSQGMHETIQISRAEDEGPDDGADAKEDAEDDSKEETAELVGSDAKDDDEAQTDTTAASGTEDATETEEPKETDKDKPETETSELKASDDADVDVDSTNEDVEEMPKTAALNAADDAEIDVSANENGAKDKTDDNETVEEQTGPDENKIASVDDHTEEQTMVNEVVNQTESEDSQGKIEQKENDDISHPEDKESQKKQEEEEDEEKETKSSPLPQAENEVEQPGTEEDQKPVDDKADDDMVGEHKTEGEPEDEPKVADQHDLQAEFDPDVDDNTQNELQEKSANEIEDTNLPDSEVESSDDVAAEAPTAPEENEESTEKPKSPAQETTEGEPKQEEEDGAKETMHSEVDTAEEDRTMAQNDEVTEGSVQEKDDVPESEAREETTETLEPVVEEKVDEKTVQQEQEKKTEDTYKESQEQDDDDNVQEESNGTNDKAVAESHAKDTDESTEKDVIDDEPVQEGEEKPTEDDDDDKVSEGKEESTEKVVTEDEPVQEGEEKPKEEDDDDKRSQGQEEHHVPQDQNSVKDDAETENMQEEDKEDADKETEEDHNKMEDDTKTESSAVKERTYEINSEEEPQDDNSETPVKSSKYTEEEADVAKEGQTSPKGNELEENLDETNNNSLNTFQPSLDTGNPLQLMKEGEYLTAVLGDPLITALAEVSRMKPSDPVAYLAVLLYRYLQKMALKAESQKDGSNDTKISNGHNGISPIRRRMKLSAGTNGTTTLQDLGKIKGEDGSTVAHYAAGKPHVNDSFFQLLRQTNYNLAERDNFYRTVRDVATETGQHDNVETIDRYVFDLVRNGKADEIERLILDGYDHILDIVDDEGNDLIMIAELTQQSEIAQQLKNIQMFQERLEILHELIRNGDTEEVTAMLEKEPKLARAKNSKGQTALHMAVLAENEDLVKLITNMSPPVVNIEDNMGRTPLHYAMGTTKPETFGKMVIKEGANPLIRDAKLHLPSFYFINNQDIQKLKEEMDQISV